jgi:hypothetical protein
MALYQLGSWEDNGYNDSDFFAAVWNSETNQVEAVLTGTTRGGMDNPLAGKLSPLNDEVLEAARVWLENHIFGIIRKAEEFDILQPSNVNAGQRVRLLENHRNKEREENQEPCRKCNGSGKWVNPHNSSDVRECFACKGKGYHAKSTVKKGGKFVTIPAGTAGEVVWCGAFGTFYRNGYNHPNRFNRSLIVKLDDGRKVNVPLEKCRLDKEPMADAELRERARTLSYDYQFCRAVGMKAWESSNEAVAYAAQRGDKAHTMQGVMVVQ